MSNAISGLDIALNRINTIERDFQRIFMMNNVVPEKPTEEFQKILDAKTTPQTGETKSASRQHIEDLIEEYSAKQGLDADFVKSLVRQESGFNPNAKSHCGAMGLMQLMPATAQGLGVKNAFDAEQNIEGGTKYLKGLMDRFDNNKELALAAYNAGPNAVKKYNGIPPYKETQNYVKSVLAQYNKMKGGTL